MRLAILIALLAGACAPLDHDHAATRDTLMKSEVLVGGRPKPVAEAAHDDHRHPGMFHSYFERLHKWAHSEDAK